jgi:hypothetical protein
MSMFVMIYRPGGSPSARKIAKIGKAYHARAAGS